MVKDSEKYKLMAVLEYQEGYYLISQKGFPTFRKIGWRKG
jgi:hypothetical protein